jgi:hypothetical protein
MLTSMMAFHWSRVSSSVSPPQAIPALLNIRSSRPAPSTTASTAAATAVASVTSRVADVAVPGPSRLSAVRAAAVPSTSVQTTSAPAATRARHNAAPMPEPAPVTIACLPLKFIVRPASSRGS